MTTPDGSASGATAASYTTNYTYDQTGNLATVTGPPVPVRTYSAQTAVTARPVTTYGYDSFGDRTQAMDPDGNVTATGYDAAGRVTSVTQPSYTPPGASSALTATTRYSYNEAGNLAQVTDPAGNATTYTYDALGDLTAQTDPQLPGQSAPGQWTYTYDAAGEQLSATSPLSEKTQATWNYFREQATATDALNSTAHYSYDYLGDQTQVTTPDGVATTNSYDHLGDPARDVLVVGHHGGRVRRGRQPDRRDRRERQHHLDHLQQLEPAGIGDRAGHRCRPGRRRPDLDDLLHQGRPAVSGAKSRLRCCGLWRRARHGRRA
jgi:YD repeat-containing protein